MRLIDADVLLDYLENNEVMWSIDEINKGNETYSATLLYDFVKNIPTAYDLDKVIAQLDEKIARLDSRQQICYEVGDFKTGDKMVDKMAAFIESKNIVKKEVKK